MELATSILWLLGNDDTTFAAARPYPGGPILKGKAYAHAQTAAGRARTKFD